MSNNPARGLRPFKPTPFGRYTLVAPIAIGGMGEIYLARVEGAHGFEKFCVIKKILAQLLQDEGFVERFVNEAKTLATLGHSSIARVLDMGVHDGEPFIALEHVDGKDLRKVISRMHERGKPPPLTYVLYVMSRVLDALAYAHRKRDENDREMGLVHRDISPQNVIVSYEGEVKVIDFGLAKSTLSSNKTNPSIILGKFLYMAPEQARHQVADRRTDLYSVGLCFYELIAGKSPFDDAPAGELMQRVAHPQIPSLLTTDPLLPPGVAQMVQKALAVAPDQRFQTAEEFRGKVLGLLLEIDPAFGPEGASSFMRETFAGEYAAERKMLVALKDSTRPSGERKPDPVPLAPATPTSPMPAVRRSSPLVASASAAARWQEPSAVTEIATDAGALAEAHAERTPAAGLFRLEHGSPTALMELGADREDTPRAPLHAVPEGPTVRASNGAPPPRLGQARSSGPRAPEPAEAAPSPWGTTQDRPGTGTMVLPPAPGTSPGTEPFSRIARAAAERRRLWGYLLLGMAASMVVTGLGYALVRALRSAPAPRYVAPPPPPDDPAPAPADAVDPSAEAQGGKKPPKKAGRRLPKTSPIHKEWAATQQSFEELTKQKPCELGTMVVLCSRFQRVREDVERFREDMDAFGTGGEADVLARIKGISEFIAAKKRER